MPEMSTSHRRSPGAGSWVLALLGAAALAAWAAITPGGTAVSTVRKAGPAVAAEPAAARVPTVAAKASPRVPAAELPAREPVASAPAQGAGEQARALLDAIVARLRLELAALPGAEPLRRCAPFATPACSTLLTDVLYELLDGRVVPAIEAREIDLGRLDRAQSAAALEPIMARLEQSEDPIERVAALVLLERASQLEAAALPSAAFSDLSGKPVIEAQLLLVYSQHEGLPDDTALREVAALAAAGDLDSRVQGAALNALARRHAPELIAAVRACTGCSARVVGRERRGRAGARALRRRLRGAERRAGRRGGRPRSARDPDPEPLRPTAARRVARAPRARAVRGDARDRAR